MTNQEAIEILSNKRNDFNYGEYEQAKKIAIECIEKCMKNCVNCASFDDEYSECDYWGSSIINGELCSCDKWESDNE